MLCTCKDCDSHTTICHSICPAYLAFRENLDEKNKEARKRKDAYSDLYNFRREGIEMMRRRMNSNGK